MGDDGRHHRKHRNNGKDRQETRHDHRETLRFEGEVSIEIAQEEHRACIIRSLGKKAAVIASPPPRGLCGQRQFLRVLCGGHKGQVGNAHPHSKGDCVIARGQSAVQGDDPGLLAEIPAIVIDRLHLVERIGLATYRETDRLARDPRTIDRDDDVLDHREPEAAIIGQAAEEGKAAFFALEAAFDDHLVVHHGIGFLSGRDGVVEGRLDALAQQAGQHHLLAADLFDRIRLSHILDPAHLDDLVIGDRGFDIILVHLIELAVDIVDARHVIQHPLGLEGRIVAQRFGHGDGRTRAAHLLDVQDHI
ncbi:hypothetical protein E4T56_gene7746, partial [Termitomyces sp. T112]